METDRHIIDQLDGLRGSKTLIVGIGSILKADDGAGPIICEELKGKISAEIIDAGTVPENYIQPIIKKAPDNLLIIDAIDFGATPGSTKIFQPEDLNSLVISTHTLSPRIFVDMIKQSIDVDVFLIGIQPADLTLGEPLSTKVAESVRSLAQMLVQVFPPNP